MAGSGNPHALPGEVIDRGDCSARTTDEMLRLVGRACGDPEVRDAVLGAAANLMAMDAVRAQLPARAVCEWLVEQTERCRAAMIRRRAS